MTTPLPSDPTPSPRPPQRSRAGEFVSWAIIAVLTLYIAGSHFIGAYLQPPSAVPLTAPDAPSFELRLAARYLIGARQLPGTSGGMMDNAIRGSLEPYLEPESSEFDSVRAIIAMGELLGPDAALEELNNLETRAQTEPLQDPGTPLDLATLRDLYLNGRDTLDPAEAQRLTDRHGWFGELASTYAEPRTDPDRAAILSACLRTTASLFIFGAIALLALIAGLALFILALVALKNRRIRFRLAEDLASVDDPRVTPYAGVLASFFVLFFGLSLASAFIPPVGGVEVGQFILWGALAAAFWPKVLGTSWRDLRRSLGWHSGAGVLREMGMGIVGYITLLPIAGLGILMVLALNAIGAQYGLEAQPHPAAGEISADPKVAIPLYLLACVWAPIVEETMFRGAFYRYLRAWARPVGAALVQGFFFAIIHPQGILGVPALMSLGFNFALIREWRGSLIGPMTAHALNNGFVFTMLLFAIG